MCRAWYPDKAGLRLTVRLQPGAKADRIDGLTQLPDGTTALKVRVTAPPADGKANAALVKLLAKRWKLAKSDIAILAGAGARQKTLRLSGDSAALAACLDADLGGDSDQ